MAKRMSILAGALLTCTVALAQSQVTGTVLDEQGQPVIGATVRVVGTNTGTVSNADGQFSLSVPNNNTRLEITYVGYEPQTIRATRNMKIQLHVQATEMDELMVVAYGTAKKSAYTGAASQIKADKIENRQLSNVTGALVGTAAGVQTYQSTGQPGESVQVRVRGVSSINGYNSPLYVVDGVPFDGDLSSINPEDIESMNVLKDAVSTSLYGSRGANGVVMITTKKGTLGKATVTVDAKWGAVARELPNYKVVKNPATYYEKLYEANFNNYKYNAGRSAVEAHQLANADLAKTGYQIYSVPEGQYLVGMNGKLNPYAKLGYSDGTNYFTPDDWEKETFKTKLRQEYNVGVSGADERFDYYTSFGFLNDQGIIEGSGFKRLSTRLNVNYRVTNWLTFGSNLSYAHSNSLYPDDQGDDDTSSSGNAFYIANFIAPVYPMYVRNTQGVIMTDPITGQNVYDYGDGASTGFMRNWMAQANPQGDLLYTFREYNSDIFNGNWMAKVDFGAGLTATARLGLNADNTIFHSSSSPLYGQSREYGGENIQEQTRATALTTQYLLNYVNGFGKHNVNATLGYEGYNYKVEDFYAIGQNIYRAGDYTVGNTIDQKRGDGSLNEYHTNGIFFSGNYNYDNRFYVNLGYRRDGTSAFAPANRWGDFFNFGLGWDMKKESWLASVDWVNQLKIRASFGQTGNDNHLVSLSAASPGYYTFYAYLDQYTLTGSNGVFSDGVLAYKGNPDLKWEKTNAFDFGVDYALLGGRLYGALDFYYRATSNLLDYKNVAMSNGYTSIPVNVGTVLNYGFEFEATYDIIKSKELNWSASLNGTFQRSKVSDLDDSYENGQYIMPSGRLIKEGSSLYQMALVRWAGVDPKTGLAQYIAKKEEDGKTVEYLTTKYNDALTTSREGTGNMQPTFYGGLGTQVAWKGFDLSLQTSFQLGGRVYDQGYADLMASGGTAFSTGQNWHQDILKAWTETNTNTDVPRLDVGDSYASSMSTRFLVSSDYFSIDNITLGYTLPKHFTRSFGIESLRLFGSAENLWVFSARQGLDPRRATLSVSNAWYTARRSVSGGIKVVF